LHQESATTASFIPTSGVAKSVFGKNNLQVLAYSKFYTAEFDLTSLFFFACPKNEPKKGGAPRAKNPMLQRPMLTRPRWIFGPARLNEAF
jgi:hypothetical protein